MSNWDRFLETFFNAKVMAKYLPDIAHGMLVTVELAALVIIAGLATGLALALLRSLGFRPLNLLIIFVVDLFRALPPLVIIVFIYFGLPAVEIAPSGFVSTWLSLALVLMAFSEEIFWAGIRVWPKASPVDRAASHWPLAIEVMPAQKISSEKAISTSASDSQVETKPEGAISTAGRPK